MVPLRCTCISFYEDADPTGRQAADFSTRWRLASRQINDAGKQCVIVTTIGGGLIKPEIVAFSEIHADYFKTLASDLHFIAEQGEFNL